MAALRIWARINGRATGRTTRAVNDAAQAWVHRRDELRRQRERRADAWRAVELTTERIQAEYGARKALLDEPLR
jgi:hypothetical protein